MNLTYTDVTDATENMICELFATKEPMPVLETEVRSAIAKAGLNAWFAHGQVLASSDTHKSEYDRLAGMVRELPESVRVQE